MNVASIHYAEYSSLWFEGRERGRTDGLGWDHLPRFRHSYECVRVHETEAESGIRPESGATHMPPRIVDKRGRLCRPCCYMLYISPRQFRARKQVRNLWFQLISVPSLLGFQSQSDDPSGKRSRSGRPCMFRCALISQIRCSLKKDKMYTIGDCWCLL